MSSKRYQFGGPPGKTARHRDLGGAGRIEQASFYGRPRVIELLDRMAARSQSIDDAGLVSPRTLIASEMPTAPQTLIVDASGMSLLKIEFVGNAIQAGAQSVRIDWEQSSDDGSTWRPDGYAVWMAGKQAVDRAGNAINHYQVMQAVEYRPDHGGNMRAVPTTWPQGTLFRLHWRQRSNGALGVTVE